MVSLGSDSILPRRCQWACTSLRQTNIPIWLSSARPSRCSLSIVRGYRDPGTCRDGAAPLLKPVVASAGDVGGTIRARNFGEWSAPAEHGSAIEGLKGPAPRSMAFRALLCGPRNRLGSLLPSSAQLRQSLLRSDIDCRHSPSAETISNTMNARLRNSIALGSALAMGLGVSTGHPLGIVAAAAMPLRVLSARNAEDAFKRALGYYIGGLWPIVPPGLGRYLGPFPTILIPLAIMGPGGNHALGSLDACGDIRSLSVLMANAAGALQRPSYLHSGSSESLRR